MNALSAPSAPASFSLAPQTLDEAFRFADMLAQSDLVPKDYQRKPGNVLVAMQWGAEVGLKPLQALQNIAVINGRPSLWGDALIALARSSPVCEYVVEEAQGDTAICRVKRRGEPEQVRTFSAADAKAAGLLGKPGPWTQYPARMRQLRARAFALRDVFPDVLRGLPVAEELQDLPPPAEKHMGLAQEVGQPSQPAGRPALPDYTDADLEANLPAWAKAVASGRKSAPDLLAMLQTKANFSEHQKARILSLKGPGHAATSAATHEPGPPASAHATTPAEAQAATPTAAADDWAASYAAAEEVQP